jgi:hypothetical protein
MIEDHSSIFPIKGENSALLEGFRAQVGKVMTSEELVKGSFQMCTMVNQDNNIDYLCQICDLALYEPKVCRDCSRQ